MGARVGGVGRGAAEEPLAVGAALQVVVEVGRFLIRRAPGGLSSGWVIGGFLAGIVVMVLATVAVHRLRARAG